MYFSSLLQKLLFMLLKWYVIHLYGYEFKNPDYDVISKFHEELSLISKFLGNHNFMF